jgi:hypothetical protein
MLVSASSEFYSLFWNADEADFQSRMNADFCLSCYYQSVFIRDACIRVIRVLIFVWNADEKHRHPRSNILLAKLWGKKFALKSSRKRNCCVTSVDKLIFY